MNEADIPEEDLPEEDIEAQEGAEEAAAPPPEADETNPGIDLRETFEQLISARKALQAEITVKRKGGDVRFVLERNSTLIGREVDCDIVLDDERVSRKHARIQRNHEGFYELRDLGSSSGLQMKGYNVEKILLADNDIFEVGATSFVFHLVAAAD